MFLGSGCEFGREWPLVPHPLPVLITSEHQTKNCSYLFHSFFTLKSQTYVLRPKRPLSTPSREVQQLVASLPSVDAKNNIFDVTLRAVAGNQQIGEAEHSPKEDVQKAIKIRLHCTSFPPDNPTGRQNQINNEVEVELRAPVQRSQVMKGGNRPKPPVPNDGNDRKSIDHCCR